MLVARLYAHAHHYVNGPSTIGNRKLYKLCPCTLTNGRRMKTEKSVCLNVPTMLLCSHVYVRDFHGMEMFSTCINGKKHVQYTCLRHWHVQNMSYIIDNLAKTDKTAWFVDIQNIPTKYMHFLMPPTMFDYVYFEHSPLGWSHVYMRMHPLCERSLHHWQPYTIQVMPVYTYKWQANGN